VAARPCVPTAGTSMAMEPPMRLIPRVRREWEERKATARHPAHEPAIEEGACGA